jgi:hypothetical protein
MEQHATNQHLEDFMLAEIRKRKINSPQLEKTLHLAATFAEVRRLGFHIFCFLNN